MKLTGLLFVLFVSINALAQGPGKRMVEVKNRKLHIHAEQFALSKMLTRNYQEGSQGHSTTKNRGFRLNLAMNETTDFHLFCMRKKYEFGFIIGDLFNMDWDKNQLSALSRLKDEPTPIEEIDFNSAIPLFLSVKLSISL